MPVGVPICPPGLEYLTQINQLLVKQKVELIEAMVGFEGANKYTIKNSMGQKVYYAKEGQFLLATIYHASFIFGLIIFPYLFPFFFFFFNSQSNADTDCCTRNCLGAPRPFTMEIYDNNSRKVLTLERYFLCFA